MSSGEFRFIAIEIPKHITLELIQNIKKSIKNISAESATTINSLICLDLSDVEVNDVSEEDLFSIGKDSLKVKKAIHCFLEEAVDLIFLPRVNILNRIGSVIHDKGFAYLEFENKLYVASGDQASFYGSRSNKAYNYLLAINLSGILNIPES